MYFIQNLSRSISYRLRGFSGDSAGAYGPIKTAEAFYCDGKVRKNRIRTCAQPFLYARQRALPEEFYTRFLGGSPHLVVECGQRQVAPQSQFEVRNIVSCQPGQASRGNER